MKRIVLKPLFIVAFTSFVFAGYSQSFQPFSENYNRLVQGISFSQDSKIMYYTLPHKERLTAMGKTVNDSMDRLAMYESSLNSDGTWSEPKLFSFSGKFHDYEPTILPDGETLLFNSRRPLNNNVVESKNNIWMSKLKNGVWQEPQSLHNLNTSELDENYATVSSSSKFIYSKEIVINGKSQYHLFETIFKGVDTQRGNKIEFPEFNKETADPHISQDGTFLIFTSFDSSNWNATCDLYISFNKNGSWSKPKAIVELNSSGPDFAVFVSADNSQIYYRRNFQFVKEPFQPILKKYREL
jgi:hypothetical protein